MARCISVLIYGCLIVLGFGATAWGQVFSAESERQRAVRERIEKILGRTASLSAVDQPLKDVVESLAAKHMIAVQIDEAALRDMGLRGSDVLVNCDFNGISLRSILNLILTKLGLTLIVEEDSLLVTSEERAESQLVNRIYLVKDLAPPEESRLDGSEDRYYYLVERTQFAAGRPEDWADLGGGDGTIAAIDHLGVLAVKQTQEIHREIEVFLKSLRKARAIGSAPSVTTLKDKADLVRRSGVSLPKTESDHVLKIYYLRPTDSNRTTPPARQLSAVIRDLIEPNSWTSKGGEGIIQSAGDVLVVRQAVVVHHQIRRLLFTLQVLKVKNVPRVSGLGGAMVIP